MIWVVDWKYSHLNSYAGRCCNMHKVYSESCACEFKYEILLRPFLRI